MDRHPNKEINAALKYATRMGWNGKKIDKRRKIIVGGRRTVVLVGFEPVRLVFAPGTEVLTAAVVAALTDTVLERAAPDVAAVDLVEIAPVVLAEMVSEEPAIDLLDEGEQAQVDGVDPELRIRVARCRHARLFEQAPGHRLAHL